MSASLIGRLGSSTFRLSTTAMSMSPTGSRFSTRRNNLWVGLAVRRRQVQADMRTHLIHRPARDIFPLQGGTRVSSYRI